MAIARDARGRFTGGGGGGGNVAGGVIGTVALDTSQVDPAIAQLNVAIGRAETQLAGLGRAGNTSGQAMANFGSRMMVAAAFVDDMQYGLRAVLNQIPQATQAIGLTAAWGGGIAIAAVAVTQLVNHWDQLVALVSTRGVETASEEMGRLAATTGKTADQQARLNELKRDEQVIEKQRTRRTGAEERVSTQAGEAIKESSYDVLLKEVQSQLMPKGNQAVDAEVARRSSAQLGPDLGGMSPRRKAAREKAVELIREQVESDLEKNVKGMAEQLIKGAESGSGRETNELMDMARKNPGLPGLSGFRARFAPVGPSKPSEDQLDANRKWLIENIGAGRRVDETGNDAVERFRKTQGEDIELREMMAETGNDAVTKWKERRDTREREMREADDKARRLLRSRRNDIIEKKIERGDPLSQEELEAMPDPLREKLGDRLTANAKRRESLQERYSDVAYRLFQEKNPQRISQSLASDQYEAGIRGASGMSEEAKQLHRIRELQEDMVRIQKEYQTIGVKRRGGGR